jgi:hypothetical protein
VIVRHGAGVFDLIHGDNGFINAANGGWANGVLRGGYRRVNHDRLRGRWDKQGKEGEKEKIRSEANHKGDDEWIYKNKRDPATR